jgi:hypothetical protein
LVTLRGLAVPVVYAWDMTDPKRPTSRRTKDRAEAKTDIVVQANGMAPQMQTVQLVERTNYVNFVLARGNVFRGRVVDESGKTIAGAIVQTDWDSRGLRTFEWTTYTDADGRFEWDSAPAESVDFWIEADGFEVIRDRSMTADDSDHEIKLTRKVSAMAGR